MQFLCVCAGYLIEGIGQIHSQFFKNSRGSLNFNLMDFHKKFINIFIKNPMIFYCLFSYLNVIILLNLLAKLVQRSLNFLHEMQGVVQTFPNFLRDYHG